MDAINLVVSELYGEIFELDIHNSSIKTDLYIIISIDIIMTRLCIDKSLKI